MCTPVSHTADESGRTPCPAEDPALLKKDSSMDDSSNTALTRDSDTDSGDESTPASSSPIAVEPIVQSPIECDEGSDDDDDCLHGPKNKEAHFHASLVRDSGDESTPASSSPLAACEDEAHDPEENADEAHFRARLVRKSTIRLQMDHGPNDDEVHEENPHLEDYLIPHHSVHFDPEEIAKEEPSTKEGCQPQGILHEETTTADPQDHEKPKRKVGFGTVLVRDYGMILGDNPCCSYGPPVTIDWDYVEYEAIDVNDYEFHHPPRRSLREMGLNYYQRKKLLADAGYTEADFKTVKKEVKRAKLNRSITRGVVSHYPLSKAEDAVESARRKFKRLMKDDHWKQQKSLFVK